MKHGKNFTLERLKEREEMVGLAFLTASETKNSAVQDWEAFAASYDQGHDQRLD